MQSANLDKSSLDIDRPIAPAVDHSREAGERHANGVTTSAIATRPEPGQIAPTPLHALTNRNTGENR